MSYPMSYTTQLSYTIHSSRPLCVEHSVLRIRHGHVSWITQRSYLPQSRPNPYFRYSQWTIKNVTSYFWL